jgi:hypothetical protein
MEQLEKIPCPNCSDVIPVKFCSSCGQKAYQRIDRKYITDEIQYTFIHINKGLFYSIKEVIKNVGKTAKSFIEGHRVSHYKPIGLAFILTCASVYLSYGLLDIDTVMIDVMKKDGKLSGFMLDYMNFTTKYNNYILPLCIPYFAIYSRWVFRKIGHNYYEHVVMGAFGYSLYMLVSILLMYPLYAVIKSNGSLLMQTSQFSILLIPIIMIWFFKGFYQELKLWVVIRKIIWASFLAIFIFFLTIFMSAIVFGYISGKAKTEAVREYTAPMK